MLDTEETCDVVVHNTPLIELSDEVIPSQTQVAVKGSGIQLKHSIKFEENRKRIVSDLAEKCRAMMVNMVNFVT